MALASSLDTIGPFAKTVEDAAVLMEIMAGHDPKDATTVADHIPDYRKKSQTDIAGLKIGVPKEYFSQDGADQEVQERIYQNIEALETQGCSIVEVSLPHTKYAIAAYYVLMSSEDSSNLARLDGIRYGVQEVQDTLYNTYSNSRAEGFPEEVKRRIMMGTYALSAGYYDAYYKKAQKVRTCIAQDFETVFSQVDVLVSPTSPFTAFGIGEKSQDPLSMYLADVLVSPASLAGVPALSVPVGAASNGLPIGLQVIGPRLGESCVLQVGHNIFNNQ
jgi:aspartyl-tRNA(Asn)/glutamyl-tRNA(Gln) amidotransferase subunit A